jgi:hypothetical protein
MNITRIQEKTHMNHKENKENLKEEKVCDLKAGYNQHTSLYQNPPVSNESTTRQN